MRTQVKQLTPFNLRKDFAIEPVHHRRQHKTGHGLRNLVKLAIQGFKRIFGNTMKAQGLRRKKRKHRLVRLRSTE